MLKVEQWEIDAIAKELKYRYEHNEPPIFGSELQNLIKPSTAKNWPRVRACVHELRAGRILPVCSDTQKGYWVSYDPEEIKACIAREEARIASQKVAIGGMKKMLEDVA